MFENSIKLHSPNSNEEYIQFYFEKNVIDFHCNVSIELRLENEILITEKRKVHFMEILKIASWYKAMSEGSKEGMSDLVIPELNLAFTKYFTEKGEGVYYLSYTSELGKIFQFQFWEQIGSSNIIIYNELMKCLENCK